MQSVVLEKPGVVRVAAGEESRAGPGEALVRLRVAGICGSDLAAYRGMSPQVSYPRVLGHELLVDVVVCPDRPELVGERAVVEPLVSCGHCRACRRGRYNCCVELRVLGVHVDGGLRDVAAVDARLLFVVPREMPDDMAVLAEPVSVAYRAVQRSAVEAGSVAVVIGAGPIGLLVTQLLVAARGCRVLVAELDPWKREVAASFGATPLPQDAEALVEAVVEATGGELADVVFEASGSAAGTRLTTAVLAQAGRIVLIGWNKGPVEVDTVALMRKEADLLGSRNSTGAFPAVLRLLEDGVIDAHAMITHRFGLDRAGEALALLDRGNEQALKILVYPRGDLYS